MEGGAGHALRQTAPQFFYRNGICYAATRATLVEDGHLLEDDCAAVVIGRPVANIDDPFELDLAGFLLAREERE